jgi:hypothetical protein
MAPPALTLLLTLLLALLPRPAAAAGPAAGIRGVWSGTPVFTPVCANGIFPGTEQDPSRTIGCDAGPEVPPAFSPPVTPIADLPDYTKDNRRDHHHVIDGPVLGNGNIGVTIGGGNRWNVSESWIDVFISTNSFWALTGANHTTGEPFRGRLALPATMQMGVARITLPPEFAAAPFKAEQDLDSDSVTVSLSSSSASAGATVINVSLFVSPLAPLIYTTFSSSGGSGQPIPIVLNTTVLPHFYHRDPHINTSFPVTTSATCSGGGDVAGVTRASDFAESNVAITGAIQHALVGAATAHKASCSVVGETSASLAFELGGGGGDGDASPVSVVSVVRTSRDPSCIARPTTSGPPKLCGLGSDAAAAAAKIHDDLKAVTVAEAKADHYDSWQRFWNTSTVSLPDAPETERFWYGAQYILNSAIPKEGQEPTPPGLYVSYAHYTTPMLLRGRATAWT